MRGYRRADRAPTRSPTHRRAGRSGSPSGPSRPRQARGAAGERSAPRPWRRPGRRGAPLGPGGVFLLHRANCINFPGNPRRRAARRSGWRGFSRASGRSRGDERTGRPAASRAAAGDLLRPGHALQPALVRAMSGLTCTRPAPAVRILPVSPGAKGEAARPHGTRGERAMAGEARRRAAGDRPARQRHRWPGSADGRGGRGAGGGRAWSRQAFGSAPGELLRQPGGSKSRYRIRSANLRINLPKQCLPRVTWGLDGSSSDGCLPLAASAVRRWSFLRTSGSFERFRPCGLGVFPAFPAGFPILLAGIAAAPIRFNFSVQFQRFISETCGLISPFRHPEAALDS